MRLTRKKCHSESAAGTQAGDDCPDHSAAKSSTADSTKDGHICLNCDHCCISHVAFPQFIAALFTPDRSQAYDVFDAVVADNVVTGLKRPPKFIV